MTCLKRLWLSDVVDSTGVMDGWVLEGKDCAVCVAEVKDNLFGEQQKWGGIFFRDALNNAWSCKGCVGDFQRHHNYMQTTLKDHLGCLWIYLHMLNLAALLLTYLF